MVIIGGGIIGLSICHSLIKTGVSVTLLEKESQFAQHQTSRNSGVIHAGPYYAPGSLKARLCSQGNALMTQFARDHGIPFEITGKLLLATSRAELFRLRNIADRAKLNEVPSEIIGRKRILELEPHAAGMAALHVKNTGIVDDSVVSEKLPSLCRVQGANLVTVQ